MNNVGRFMMKYNEVLSWVLDIRHFCYTVLLSASIGFPASCSSSSNTVHLEGFHRMQ